MTNLYELIGATTPNGVWEFGGGQTSPAAPFPFDADIDFTGFPTGVRSYKYTVSNACGDPITAVLTVDYQSQKPFDYDFCTSPYLMPAVPSDVSLTTADSCPGTAAPTKDVSIPYPNQWGNAVGDAWFRFSVDNANSLSIYLSGSNFTDGIFQPKIALYEGICGNLNLISAKDSQTNSPTVSDTIFFNPAIITEKIYYLRVSSTTEGRFVLNITKNTA